MGDTVDPKLIKKTQDTLGKVISKPPLTEKLLQKPPFRFLHDICTAVIKKTGFMTGLFTANEMVSENVKDRDNKITFLQKLIDMVILVTGKSLSVRPSSIISGKECDKTNELLQCLAEAVNKNVNNDEYVARVLKGDKKKPAAEPAEPAAPETGGGKERGGGGHHRERERDPEKDKERRTHSRDKEPDVSKDKRRGDEKERGGGGGGGKERSHHRGGEESAAKDGRKDRADAGGKEKREEHRRGGDRKDRDRDAEEAPAKKDSRKERDHPEEAGGRKDKRERDRGGAEESSKHRRDKESKPPAAAAGSNGTSLRQRRGSRDQPPPASNDTEQQRKSSRDKNNTNGQNDADEDENPVKLQRPASAKGHRRRKDGSRDPRGDGNEEDEDESRFKPAEHADEAARRSAARPPTSRLAPPKPRRPSDANIDDTQRITSATVGGKVSGVIIEREQDSDDDQFVVEETIGGGLDNGLDMRTSNALDEDENVAEHGGLVNKMLQSKKNYETDMQKGKGDSEKSLTLDEASRKRDRLATEKEVERIRSSLQTLTRSANPLAKIMDYIQEDLDAMQKELERWRAENKELNRQLLQEQSLTDSASEPLKKQLKDMEMTIQQQNDAIALFKSKIAANDEKLAKMLTNVCQA